MCSLLSGILSNDGKLARVSPIYKSGDKQECKNYPPISALSVAAKNLRSWSVVSLNAIRKGKIF